MKPRPHHASLVKLLSVLGDEPIVGVEIGVAKGGLSRHILSTMPNVKTLYLVDKWDAASPEAYIKTGDPAATLSQVEHKSRLDVVRQLATEYAGRVEIRQCRSTSPDLLAEMAAVKPDFAFIDADHSYEGVSADIAAWWPLIAEDGILCGHDYAKDGTFPGVYQAVNEFAERNNLQVIALDGSVWGVWK